MKIFRMLGRSIRDAFKSVFRNFSLSLASISCITITLIIVAVSVIASFNVDHFTKEIEKDLTIVAFVKGDATKEQVKEVEKDIKSMSNVDSYKFKSKEEVKEEMAKQSEAFKSVMDEWSTEDNPLKDTFQIKVKKAEEISATAKKINKMEYISTVRYGEGMVDKLVGAFSVIEKVAYGVVIALILVAMFLIMNTIKLTIFSRKREISIMRLVGASNFSIKTPFIFEGMILGFMGAIIPVLVTVFGYTTLYKNAHGYLFTELVKMIKPEPFIYMASGIIILIGILVGMIGSASAVRKYLKV